MALNTAYIKFQPLNPPLDKSAATIGLNGTFQNTSVQQTLSFRLPAITRRVQGFVLSGAYVIGPTTPGSSAHALNLCALATAHAKFPKRVGVHALFNTVTLTTGNGTVYSLENNYTEWCFRNARASQPNTAPSSPVGVFVEFSESATADYTALTVGQIPRQFLLRLRFRSSSDINLLAMGGLQLDLTFSSIAQVATFPQLCFPLPHGADTSYLNQGYIRPWVFPAVKHFQSTTHTIESGNINFGYVGSTGSADLENLPIQFSANMTPQQFAQSLTSYISCTLLALVDQALVTTSDQETTYQSKAFVSSFLPMNTTNYQVLPFPIAGYTGGNAEVKPVIMGAAVGLGWTNMFQFHAFMGVSEWRFNSSLPGFTYPIFGNVLDEYSPTLPTALLDIMRADRFLSGRPLQTILREGVGQYYLGKTFLGATSLSVLITSINANTFYPQIALASTTPGFPVMKTVQTSEVSSLSIYAYYGTNADNQPYGGSLACLTNSQVDSSLLKVLQAVAKASGNISTGPVALSIPDNSRSYYNGRLYTSSVLPYSGRGVPPVRSHYDSRTVFILPKEIPGFSSEDKPPAFFYPSLQAFSTPLYFGVDSQESYTSLNVGALGGYTALRTWYASGCQRNPETKSKLTCLTLAPLVRSVPYQIAPAPAPSNTILNWQFTMDTFETRRISSTSLTIAPDGNSTPSIVNPVTFRSHPLSPASKSPLYYRAQPMYEVDPMYEGNYAIQWNALTMGTVAATKIQVPIRVQDDELSSHDPTAIPFAPMYPMHAYAPVVLTAANRFVNRPCGDLGCLRGVTYITPQGIIRSMDERKYIAWQMQGMSPSERLAYEQQFRGHGAIVSTSDNTKRYHRSSRIYANQRPSDRYSLVQYNGYQGYNFSDLGKACPKYSPLSATNTTSALGFPPAASLPKTLFAGDRMSLLSSYPQYMVMSAHQSPTLRGPLSFPQTPEKQIRLEFDQQLGNVINVCAGGGAFTVNRADPHVEMAMDACRSMYGVNGGLPARRLQPRLLFADAPKAVVRQLVYNPADMPEITALAFAQGVPLKIPTSVSYDTYQSLERIGLSASVSLDLNALFQVSTNAFTQFSRHFVLSNEQLTIYSADPMPLGGLNIDNIRISVRAGHYDTVSRSPTVLPLIQPRNALFQSSDDVSMSLFNVVNTQNFQLSGPSPPSNGVYMRPQVDGMDLRTVEPYFGTPLTQIEQYSLMTGGKMIPLPHHALFETGFPYLTEPNVFVPHWSYQSTTDNDGVENTPVKLWNACALPDVVPFLDPSDPAIATMVARMYQGYPALSGNASLVTLYKMSAMHPAQSNPLLLYTHMALGNARLLSYNFQFNNMPINTISPGVLADYLSTYYVGFNQKQDNTSQFNPVRCYMSAINVYATPLVYTQTIDLFSMDEWIMTQTGVVCVSKAFAR